MRSPDLRDRVSLLERRILNYSSVAPRPPRMLIASSRDQGSGVQICVRRAAAANAGAAKLASRVPQLISCKSHRAAMTHREASGAVHAAACRSVITSKLFFGAVFPMAARSSRRSFPAVASPQAAKVAECLGCKLAYERPDRTVPSRDRKQLQSWSAGSPNRSQVGCSRKARTTMPACTKAPKDFGRAG